MIDDLAELRSWARGALERGAVDEALESLFEAARHTHVPESEYAPIVRMLAEALGRKGDTRGALTALWCTSVSSEAAWRGILQIASRAPAVDRARTLAAMRDEKGAAAAMEEAGLVAQAAIYRERAKEWDAARALWSRLTQVVARGRDAADDAYNAALAEFNLARCAGECKDPRRAREAFVASVRLLEEAADDLETRGLRERAFDCYNVLVEIGRASGAFEHVLEGYINCIRILREDHLKLFALQYYEDAVAAAKAAGELGAAATIAREGAVYARAVGEGRIGAHHLLDQAASLREAARLHEERGAPPELAENSLLAAILANGELGKFAVVGSLYSTLSEMDLEPSRRAHYARAARRYDGVRDEPTDAAPLARHLRSEAHALPVWHLDLVEWEQQGSAVEACGDVLLDLELTSQVRRDAMLARLSALRVEAAVAARLEATKLAELRVRLVEDLRSLGMYTVLAPLERLYEEGDRPVKLAVLAEIGALHFKRSFVTVQRALRDPDPQIVAQAARTVAKLAFRHALDPLARILRDSDSAEVRAAALRAIAHVDSPAAAELLLGVIEHGAPVDREAARRAIGDRPSHAVEQAMRTRARAS